MQTAQAASGKRRNRKEDNAWAQRTQRFRKLQNGKKACTARQFSYDTRGQSRARVLDKNMILLGLSGWRVLRMCFGRSYRKALPLGLM